MFPVLFHIGSFTITSFGLLSAIGLVGALYIIWRLSILHEMDKEKIIDLFFLLTISAVIGARLFFILFNSELFPNIASAFQILKYPGFYFWGGFITALVLLIFLLRKNKDSFWQLADIVIVGLFIYLGFTSIGCLLGSCQYGYPLPWPITVYQSGLIERRFPIQVVNAFAYFTIFYYLYRKSFRFHFTGMIASIGLIWLAIINFIIAFFRADISHIFWFFSTSQILSVFVGLFGVYGYYKQGKRSIAKDARTLVNTCKRKLGILK